MAKLDTPPVHPAQGQHRQQQLPLAVHLRDDATLENFLALPRMESLLRALRMQAEPGGEAVIYLHGPAGCGKSHLLQAACHAGETEAVYLPLQELRRYPAAEVLQGVERLGRVCIDDLHAVLGNAEWERALFNLYNEARQRDCRLVFSADAAPRALAVGLDDLRSRLAWGVVYQLARADDTEKAAILQFRAARRGLTLSPEVAGFIVSRAPRALGELIAVLDLLDNASLSQQRSLSIPFVKQALNW